MRKPGEGWRSLVLAVAVLCLSPSCRADDLIGSTFTYSVQRGDTLLDVARRFDLGFAEIMAANPDVDPWLPAPGDSLLIAGQHVLPAAPRSGIVINLGELRLYLYPRSGSEALSFPIGIGREGWETPVGWTRGEDAARVNWETVHITVRQMRGIAVQITSPRR